MPATVPCVLSPLATPVTTMKPRLTPFGRIALIGALSVGLIATFWPARPSGTAQESSSCPLVGTLTLQTQKSRSRALRTACACTAWLAACGAAHHYLAQGFTSGERPGSSNPHEPVLAAPRSGLALWFNGTIWSGTDEVSPSAHTALLRVLPTLRAPISVLRTPCGHFLGPRGVAAALYRVGACVLRYPLRHCRGLSNGCCASCVSCYTQTNTVDALLVDTKQGVVVAAGSLPDVEAAAAAHSSAAGLVTKDLDGRFLMPASMPHSMQPSIHVSCFLLPAHQATLSRYSDS